MAFDYSKLRGRVIEKYRTLGKFADAMNLSLHSVANKINDKQHWKQMEIIRAIKLLDIPVDKIGEYFFNENS